MTRILVTGCSGFLATYLIDRLLKMGGMDIQGITEVKDFKSDLFRVHHLDIRDQPALDRLVKSFSPEMIFHLAAVSNVAFSWKNPKLTYEVNIIGSSNLMESVRLHCPETRLLLMSSAELYGSGSQDAITENQPTLIRNPYALSKLAMEIIGNMVSRSYGTDIIKVRSFNFTGPGQASQFVCSDFASQIAMIEKGRQEPVIKVGNLSAVRDFSDVRDIAAYLIEIGLKGDPNQLYHVCSGKGLSIRSILDTLLSLSNSDIEVVVEPSKFRPIDTPVLVGDCMKIREQFGCHPRYEFPQTLLDILNHWRERIQ